MVSTNRSNLLFLAQMQFIRSSVANVLPRSLSGEADLRNYCSTAVNFDFEDHVISCPCFTPGTFGAHRFLKLIICLGRGCCQQPANRSCTGCARSTCLTPACPPNAVACLQQEVLHVKQGFTLWSLHELAKALSCSRNISIAQCR